MVVQLLEGAKLIRVEATRLTKDGTEIVVNLSAVPLMDAKNEAYGVLAVISDITEQKRGEADLINARDLADKATRAKSEFLAIMSREIRTRINGVIGMTGLLLDTKLDSEQREYAETVRSSADSLLTIINDILDFSKIEAGKLDIELITFDIDDLREQVTHGAGGGAEGTAEGRREMARRHRRAPLGVSGADVEGLPPARAVDPDSSRHGACLLDG